MKTQPEVLNCQILNTCRVLYYTDGSVAACSVQYFLVSDDGGVYAAIIASISPPRVTKREYKEERKRGRRLVFFKQQLYE